MGVKVCPGASIEELEAFERRRGVTLPSDVRELMLTENGFEDGEWDDELNEWYPLSKWERMTEVYHVSDPIPDVDDYFVFADYCLHGWLYAVRLTPAASGENTVIGYCAGGKTPVWQIADSFTGLIEAYLRDPVVMYG
jgi:hypothetical protein